MKSLLLILILSVYSLQSDVNRYKVVERCNLQTKKCEPFDAIVRVEPHNIRVYSKGVGVIDLEVKHSILHYSSDRYTLGKDTVINGDTLKIYRGYVNIQPQTIDSNTGLPIRSSATGKVIPANIDIEVAIFTNPPEFFHVRYKYNKKM